MRDAASELANRIHFLGVQQLLLKLLSIGDVQYCADEIERPASTISPNLPLGMDLSH